MTARRTLQSIVIVAVLAMSFASAGSVWAGAPGCDSRVTVQWGDTLDSIAAACGITTATLRAANPGLGWVLMVGQVLIIPSGDMSAPTPNPAQISGSYIVQSGDTLGGIAMAYGVSLSDLLAVNPQIWNVNTIFPGQAINLPASALNYSTYTTPGSPGAITLSFPNPAATSSPFAYLKITYGHGLLVRTGPGIENPEIKSAFVSAVKFSHWQYRKDSLTTDSIGFVWVQITLSPLSGYSSGWILVRDSLGMYFTQPNLGPKITPNDP